jgi:hypothetical protein
MEIVDMKAQKYLSAHVDKPVAGMKLLYPHSKGKNDLSKREPHPTYSPPQTSPKQYKQWVAVRGKRFNILLIISQTGHARRALPIERRMESGAYTSQVEAS